MKFLIFNISVLLLAFGASAQLRTGSEYSSRTGQSSAYRAQLRAKASGGLTPAPFREAAQDKIRFTGTDSSPIEYSPDAQSGLQAVYVLRSTSGVKAVYTASSATVTWQQYSNLGGGYAQELNPEKSGNEYTVSLSGDMGYIITDGSSQFCFWVVDYASHLLDLQALILADEQDCDRVSLHLEGNASPISYFTVNGAPRVLPRDLTLSYTTLAFDAEAHAFSTETRTETVPSVNVNGEFYVQDVYCNTQFTLSGDAFLTFWGAEQSVESEMFTATAVTAETSATVEEHNAENEQPVEGSALGGSAPVNITFTASVTDAAAFTEWEIATDEEFGNIVDRYSQTEFQYSFTEAGTKYVRFNCADASGKCTFTSETYEVYVGESALLCPNAFSPLNDDGVNDEWRVSYKSIIDFDCHIFNRHGKELAHLTHPSQGWDGTAGGKKVSPGVYFYVIKATGSDGKEYNLSGDINIVGMGKSLPGSATPSE